VDLVESGEHAKADGGTAAETTRAGDISTHHEAIWFPWEFSGFVISRYDFRRESIRSLGMPRLDGDVVIEIEG
jgi:hypothetical protein